MVAANSLWFSNVVPHPLPTSKWLSDFTIANIGISAVSDFYHAATSVTKIMAKSNCREGLHMPLMFIAFISQYLLPYKC